MSFSRWRSEKYNKYKQYHNSNYSYRCSKNSSCNGSKDFGLHFTSQVPHTQTFLILLASIYQDIPREVVSSLVPITGKTRKGCERTYKTFLLCPDSGSDDDYDDGEEEDPEDAEDESQPAADSEDRAEAPSASVGRVTCKHKFLHRSLNVPNRKTDTFLHFTVNKTSNVFS